MAWFEKALEANVMSTKLLVRADLSVRTLKEAYAIAKAFEARYSAYREDSFVHYINTHAAEEEVHCRPEDIALFQRALLVSQETNGKFDITIGALSHGAYKFGFKEQGIPAKEHLKRMQKLVDYRNIRLGADTISFLQKGMRIDLGGIGKGYCARLIARFLLEKGASKFLVDVGGEMVTYGKRYAIAVKNPFEKGNIALIKTQKELSSFSTSGNYERYIGDTAHHHILDAKQGASHDRFASMTVMQNGIAVDLLDAYATALFNDTPQNVRRFAKEKNISVITIDTAGDVAYYNMRGCRIASMEFQTF